MSELEDIVIKFVPSTSVMYEKQKTAREEAMQAIEAYISKRESALLDRIEQSLKSHTTPEGEDLLTRSYVENTINFEREKLKGE